MAVLYEVNPPRVAGPEPGPAAARALLAPVARRVSEIAGACGGIHVTESVMGTRRLSPIAAGGELKRLHPGLAVTVSMRTMGRDMAAAERFARGADGAGLDGMLVVRGDPAPGAAPGPCPAPSDVVRRLRRLPGRRAALLLSVGSRPDFGGIARKVAARPDGFVTQVVSSLADVERTCARLRPEGFRVVPIVLLPSDKNARSARLLGLDWSGYEGGAAEFVRGVHRAAGDVMVTSPNDFAAARDLLGTL